MVEAYFANKGLIGTGKILNYWMGGYRQPNPDQMNSNTAAQAPWYLVTGKRLALFSPSSGEGEAPMYAPYTHWSPAAFQQSLVWGSANSDCLLVALPYGCAQGARGRAGDGIRL